MSERIENEVELILSDTNTVIRDAAFECDAAVVQCEESAAQGYAPLLQLLGWGELDLYADRVN